MTKLLPPEYEGFIEYLSSKRVAGWVRDVGKPDALTVQILHAQKVIGQAIADITRQDLKDSGKGAGAHAFEFYFPVEIHDFAIRDRIQVRIAGTDISLRPIESLIQKLTDVAEEAAAPLTQRRETNRTVDPGVKSSAAGPGPGDGPSTGAGRITRNAPPAQAATAASGRAGMVGFEDGYLVGWAITGYDSAAIIVTVDGAIVGEANAVGSARANRLLRGAELARNGFDLPIPEGLSNGKERKVAIYRAVDGKRLVCDPDVFLFPKPREPQPAAAATRKVIPPRDAGPRNETQPLIGVPQRTENNGRALDVAARPATTPPASGKVVEGKVAEGHISASPAKRTDPRRVAVVAWDLAHNPVGRAFLLADLLAQAGEQVELVGPTFAFYGGKVWPPIADTAIPLKTFPVTSLRDLVAGAVALAEEIQCSAVVVGKPRLSSLLLGALIRYKNDCPLILDIDDHELSFVKKHEPASFDELKQSLAIDGPDSLPQSDVWTRFVETLVPEADGIIVSNVALRQKFGGMIVRHARNERLFDPALYDRAAIRAEFGYNENDRVILFLGTPRIHKGIFEIADAMERLADPRLALCVIGSFTDKRLLAKFAAYKVARISLNPDQPWSRLPELVNMADQVAILQDPAHPIAEFQIPAKLTDSLALGVPVVATPVPPLRDLELAGIFETVRNNDDLDRVFSRLAAGPQRGGGGSASRQGFLTEFSYGVNAARLNLAIEEARKSRNGDLRGFERLFRFLEEKTGVALPRLVNTPPRKDRRVRIRKSDEPRDLVFLWKQNDSDLYGRRSDMIARYMLQSGRVRRVIHFDAPLSAGDLDRQAAAADGATAHQGNLVYVNTVRRILGTADTSNFIRRTFLYRSGSRPERAFGRDLPAKDAYPDFIRRVMEETEMNTAPILWVCPVVFDYQAVADVIKPAAIIADLIDDQRTFPGDSEVYRQRVTGAYETVLREADAVFTNCVAVRDAFAAVRSGISVVPNGAELLRNTHTWGVPDELAKAPRPIIGYVGNLRDRIDTDLIEAVAQRFPHGTIVLIGSAHGRPEIASLPKRYPNVKLLGVKPYDDAKRFIRAFDVAIMPHLKTEQSDRMNPLKLYVYFSVGVPIVTTEVANIGDLAPYVNVADSHAAFLDKIGEVLAGRGTSTSSSKRKQVLEGLSWDRRVENIWTVLDQATGEL